MNICITGALGHIGSALIRKINNVEGTMYLVDNLLTQRYASLFDLPRNYNYVFFHKDILSEDMEHIVKKSDVVIHLAAITDAESSAKNRAPVERVNRKGLKNILDLCSKYKKPIIFPSTTSVYGSQSNVVDEQCRKNDLKPQSPYAHSKLYGERLIQRMCRRGELRAIILRVGTIYGYSIGMRFHTAVNKFIFQAVTGESITVWKTAMDQRRPYCSLDDFISSINVILKNDYYTGEIYNLVSQNLTVREILTTIQLYIPTVHISYVDSRIMNQLSYTVDNKKSRNIGIVYKGNISRSIKETIKHLMKINSQTEVHI